MWTDAYLNSRVLSANPLELIQILYQHALDSVRDARRSLAAGDIAARSKSISSAIAAVSELNSSLDHYVGGELSWSLAELYQYIRRRLTEANVRQKDAPLAEAESLLATLSEAWKKPEATPAKEIHRAEAFPEAQAMAFNETQSGGAHTWSA